MTPSPYRQKAIEILANIQSGKTEFAEGVRQIWPMFESLIVTPTYNRKPAGFIELGDVRSVMAEKFMCLVNDGRLYEKSPDEFLKIFATATMNGLKDMVEQRNAMKRSRVKEVSIHEDEEQERRKIDVPDRSNSHLVTEEAVADGFAYLVRKERLKPDVAEMAKRIFLEGSSLQEEADRKGVVLRWFRPRVVGRLEERLVESGTPSI